MPRGPSSDPSVKVFFNMPASVYQRLREHAAATGSNMSRICREGALRALADAEAAQQSGSNQQ